MVRHGLLCARAQPISTRLRSFKNVADALCTSQPGDDLLMLDTQSQQHDASLNAHDNVPEGSEWPNDSEVDESMEDENGLLPATPVPSDDSKPAVPRRIGSPITMFVDGSTPQPTVKTAPSQPLSQTASERHGLNVMQVDGVGTTPPLCCLRHLLRSAHGALNCHN